MRFSPKRLAATAAGLGLLAGAPFVAAQGDWRDGGFDDRRGDDLTVVGLTDDQRLVTFSDDDPSRVRTLGAIRGLTTDAKIVGIDYRPASGNDGDSGDLYGLGDRGGVYTIDEGADATLRSRLDVALVGTRFGVDFNPVVDRMRIISDTGQNLRHNVDVNGGTLSDGTLTYPGPPSATATGVSGAAYTNNDRDPGTATTLYDIDSTMNQTVIQSPANAGLLAATGKLGVDAGPEVGFDIYSTVRSGSTVDVKARASLTVGGRASLYSIALFNGRARSLGTIGTSSPVVDIAIPLNQL